MGKKKKGLLDDLEDLNVTEPVVSKKNNKKKNKKNFFDEDAALILAQLDQENLVQENLVQEDLVQENIVLNQEKSKNQFTNEINTLSNQEIHSLDNQEMDKQEQTEKQTLNKSKKKKKKQPQQPQPVFNLEDLEIEDDTPAPKKAPEKRKGPAGLSALKEAMLARQQAQEEQEKKEREAKLLIEQELAREKEAEQKKEEARLAKKERERLKKEQLKKEGKYLTPAEKKAQALQQARRAQLLASGNIKVAALNEQQPKPKRIVYGDKKKKKRVQDQLTESEPPKDSGDQVSQEEAKISKNEYQDPLEEPKIPKEEESEKEDWEIDSDKEIAPPQPAEPESEKEDWEIDSDEEIEELTPKPVPVPAPNPQNVAQAPKSVKSPTPIAEAPSIPPVELKQPHLMQKKSKADHSRKNTGAHTVSNPKPAKVVAESSSSSEPDSTSDSESSSDEEERKAKILKEQRKRESAERRKQRYEAALAARSESNLRSPICVIMGHVDTGKTKILDKIRQTSVQEGEAGGITQQIGATFFPVDAINEKTKLMRPADTASDYRLPGLLVIDTPGHESFSNLRSRGSSLCNIAVLVVDIVHGLEPQTLESLNMLRARKTPFIVALNKIDRMFDWKANPDFPTRETLALQKKHVLKEFENRVTKTIVEFAEQGLNACLYWENKNIGKYVSLVPTSAVTGEGIPDLLHLLMDLSQTRMLETLMYHSELECTVLEVKVIEGLGTTIDVVLTNGILHEGDKIVVCGLNGPIITQIRALVTPQPMRELRVKGMYQHHKSVKAALGVKISATDLEKAVAGARLMVLGPEDDEDDVSEQVMGDLQNLMSSIDSSGKGVLVQASTLGSLEALLAFLEQSKIPVSGVNIGPVHKKDIMRASIMLERAPQYAQMLAFDVPIDKDAADMAEDMGIKIFSADIIYHLFDKFTQYMKDLEEQKRKDLAPRAIFPCHLKMIRDTVFNKRNPIIIGVDVIAGDLRIGTPLCVINKETRAIVGLGKCVGIELNHKPRQSAKKGDPAVAVRIEGAVYETPKAYGRHFTEENDIYSLITRDSIDIIKTSFRSEMTDDYWKLVIRLKSILGIQ